MTLFKDLGRWKDWKEKWDAARRPAYGIIDRAERGGAATASPPLAVEPDAYDLVPQERLRADRAHPDSELDQLAGQIERGNWRGAADYCEAIGENWERRREVLCALAALAADDDLWLDDWIATRPQDATALAVRGQVLVDLAWRIRGCDRDKELSPVQREGFVRVLRQVPAICLRAADLWPQDPTALVTLLTAARGLDWSRADFRALWARVRDRDRFHVDAHREAMLYWLREGRGSAGSAGNFVDGAIALAPAGSLLTSIRLQMLFLARRSAPRDGTRTTIAREAADTAETVRIRTTETAASAALADLAEADPTRPQLATMRHLLAYHLTEAGWFAAAVEQFRLIDGYCGALPWTHFPDPSAAFTEQRAKAILGRDGARPSAAPPLKTSRAGQRTAASLCRHTRTN